jgi:hypothetical protein
VHSRQNATRNEGKTKISNLHNNGASELDSAKFDVAIRYVHCTIQCFFWGQFCDVTKMGIIRRKDLAKLRYNKQDMKINK